MSSPPPPPPANAGLPPPPAPRIPPPPPGLVLTTTGASSLANGIKALVYGRSGRGKTRLCGTAPRPIIISAEAGLLSLSDKPDIPVLEINTVDDLNRSYDWLSGPAGATYFTVCLDSLSEIGEKVLTNAKAGTKDGRQAYGTLADQMWTTIRAFRDLKGKCVLMTAKAEYVKDDATGVTKWMPSMPGRQLTNGLPYFFDEVFYIDKFRGAGGEFHALQTSADLQYDAKDRSGKLDFYEHPDMTAVFNKIYGVK